MKKLARDINNIDFEITKIEKEIIVIKMIRLLKTNTELDEIQIRAAASTLHSIYNGI